MFDGVPLDSAVWREEVFGPLLSVRSLINCSGPAFVQGPWGGFKRSGVGRELGRWGLESFLEVKQVTRYRSSKPWGWYLK